MLEETENTPMAMVRYLSDKIVDASHCVGANLQELEQEAHGDEVRSAVLKAEISGALAEMTSYAAAVQAKLKDLD